MNEYFFTDEDPAAVFSEISAAKFDDVRLEKRIGDSTDVLEQLSSAEIQVLNPRAELFQETFEKLGITPKPEASEYMRIILMGDESYGRYEKATEQGAELDGITRFEDSSPGITGETEMLKELDSDLKSFSRKKEYQPWIVISKSSYEPRVKGICERCKG